VKLQVENVLATSTEVEINKSPIYPALHAPGYYIDNSKVLTVLSPLSLVGLIVFIYKLIYN